MVKYTGAKIVHVEPGSIGDGLGLKPGDILVKINDIPLCDRIDYLMMCSEETLQLEVLKSSGNILEIEFTKDPAETLGLSFEDDIFDGIKICSNHCIFCFVHQLPPGQRASLYIHDDDYRLSFLQGSYITLTNLTEADWQKIEKWRLSPLYISVHATEPRVRQKLLGSKQPVNILEQLRRLAKAGITMHTQAVICPGINDGPILEKTIRDLAGIWPKVASLAVVPVGLTKERRNLFPIKPFTKESAATVLEIVEYFQDYFLKISGTRFVFAADEWYIIAGKEFPADEAYEDYWQLDNGIGLIRRFLTDFDEVFWNHAAEFNRFQSPIIIVTGKATARLWDKICRTFKQYCPELTMEILDVPNNFLGTTVTVTGLLAGNDIIQSIMAHPASPSACYLVPRITLKQDEDLFIDGVSLEQLITACLPKRVMMVPTSAAAWLNWLIEHKCLFR